MGAQPQGRPMTEISYEQLRPLIASQDVQGSQVRVVFRCPKSGASHESSAGMQRGRGVKDIALKAAKQSAWYSLRNSLMRAISSALGHGVVGSVGRQVSSQLMHGATASTQWSGGEIEAAVVQAFVRVQNKFRPEGQSFVAVHGSVAPDAVDTGFHKQLREAPISERYDQGVLARVLVELAKGDGRLSPEEQSLLSSFLDPSLGTIDQLASRPPLSAVELSETSAAARDTILMLGWALALSDNSLAPSERARLDQVAAGFQLAADRVAALRGHAQHFLLDQALDAAYRSGTRDATLFQQAMQVATALGFDPESAERADIRYRKARGIV